MATQIGLKLAIDGEAAFRKSINDINTSYSTLKSEMATVTSAFEKNDKSQENLTKQNAVLNKQIDLQNQKITETTSVLEKSAAKYGENSKETQSWQRAVNTSTTELNKLERQLKTNNSVIDEGTKHTGLFGTAMRNMGIDSGAASAVIGGTGIAAGMFLNGAIKSATDAESATRGLTTLIQNQGETSAQASGDVSNFTSKIKEMSSYSAGEAKEALTTLANKGISAGDSIKYAGTIADVAAAQNISLSSAADLVANAYNGKARALTTLGILTKAEAKQLGNTETATITMSDVQERLNKRYSGSAQSDLSSYSGQLKVMQNQMGATQKAVGDAMLPVLGEMAKIMGKVLTPIEDFITKNPKLVAGVMLLTFAIGTVVAAVALGNFTIGVMTPILTVAAEAIGLTGISAGLAAPAVGALGVAFDLLTGPIGLVLLGVGALAAGIAFLCSTSDENTDATGKQTDATGKQIDATGKQTDATGKNIDATGKQIDATDQNIEANKKYIDSNEKVLTSIENDITSRQTAQATAQGTIDTTQILADKIYDLAGKQNKSSTELSELNIMIKKFNELMPTATLQLDDQTGALDRTKEETDALIESEKKRIELTVVVDAMVQVKKDELEVARQMHANTQDLVDIETKHKGIIDEINASMQDGAEKTQKLADENKAYGEKLDGLKKPFDDAKDKMKELQTQEDEYNKFISDPTAFDEYVKNTDKIPEAMGVAIATVDGALAANDKETAALSEKTGKDLATGVAKGVEAGAPEVKKAGSDTYSIVNKTIEPLTGDATDIGTQTSDNLASGINDSAPEVNNAALGVYESTTEPLTPLGEFGKKTGGELNTGLQDGMSDKTGIDETIGGIVTWVIDTFHKLFDINSPSRKTHQIGVHVITGLLNGMSSLDVGKFAGNLVNDLLGQFNAGKVSIMKILETMGSDGSALLGKMGIQLPNISGGNFDISSVGGDAVGWLKQAMAITGQTGDDNLSHLENIMMNESGGNPNAINLWDSNAMAGIPSMGLMQTIQSTFDSYSLGGSIWDPVANAVAAIRYMIAAYGSIANTGTHGYAVGTNYADPGVHLVGELGPELINFRGGETVTTAAKTADIINNSNSSNQTNQPAVINLVLQNGKIIAEYLIDDINNMLGVKSGLAGRGMA